MTVIDERLADKVSGREWYTSIVLSPDVVAPGWFDTRSVARRLPFPVLEGKRCLDVGTFDGFWAFEMEKRGAAEVVAIDILDPTQWDWPVNFTGAALDALASRKGQGEGFEVARHSLGSKVK